MNSCILSRPSHSRRASAATMALLLVVIGAGLIVGGVYIGKLLAEKAPQKQTDTTPVADTQNVTPAEPQPAERTAVAEPASDNRSSRPAPKAGQPPVTFEPPLLDLGTVPPNVTKRGTIEIINPTDQPLKILATRASCTCTAINMANTVIPPGGRVPLEIGFDTRSTLGDKKSSVKVLIEGWADTALVDIKAAVSLAVYADPPYIRATEEATGEFSVLSQDGQPFNILTINGEKPTFVDFDPKTDEPRNNYRIAWDFGSIDESACFKPDGREIRPWWVITTDHPGCPVFDIQVRHICTRAKVPTGGRRWVLGDRRLLVGELKPGESKEFITQMKWFPNATPNDRVMAAISTSPYLKAELVEFKENGKESDVKIRLTALDNIPEGEIYTNVQVTSRTHSADLLLTGVVTR